MEQVLINISSMKAIHDLARRNKLRLEYKLENESGPAHAKVYTVRLRFGTKEYISTGHSIKSAQRHVAQVALNENRHLQKEEVNQPNKETNKSVCPTVTLNTWASQNHVHMEYILIDEQYISVPMTPSSSLRSRTHTVFYYRLIIGRELSFEGHGLSHRQARTHCAYQALIFIHQNPTYFTPSSLPSPSSSSSTSSEIDTKSSISLMYERAKQLGHDVKIENNDPLTITYRIGEQYSTTATGTNKKAAKRLAAEKMLTLLPVPIDTDGMKLKTNRKRHNQHQKFIEQKGSLDYSLSKEMNPITRVYQIARARNITVEFVDVGYITNEKLFHFHVQFNETECSDGYGKNKQTAKRIAAENLLSKLSTQVLDSISPTSTPLLPPAPTKGLLKRDENSAKSQEKKHVHFIENELIEHENNSSKARSAITIKQQLINACAKLHLQIQYDDQTNNEDTTKYETTLSLLKGDRLLAQFRASAPSINRAQENVSVTAWRSLRQLFNGSIQIPSITNNNVNHMRQDENGISVQKQ